MGALCGTLRHLVLQSVLEEALTLAIGRRSLLSCLALLQLSGTSGITDALYLQHLCSIKEPHRAEPLPVRLTDRDFYGGHIERLHQRLRSPTHHEDEATICSRHNAGRSFDPALNQCTHGFPILKGC